MKRKQIPRIEGTLPVSFFSEDKKVIAYCPLLDLSTCGKDFNQAKKRFLEALELFFEETDDLEAVLLEYGWQKVGRPSKLVPPRFIGQTQEEVCIPMHTT